jgi:hypothetical protein
MNNLLSGRMEGARRSEADDLASSLAGTTRTSTLPFSCRFYFLFRIFLHKKRWLLRSAQIIRGLWVLGPVRPYAIRYYQRRVNNGPLQVDTRDLFPKLEVDQVVNSLNEKGYAHGFDVPAEYVTQILQYAETTGLLRWWNPHKECDAIDHIARNGKIVQIAKRYLGTEPILWLTQLRWSFGDGSPKRKRFLSKHIEPLLYDPGAFHYDILDYKSLTLFIYLTDVDPSSGPHVVIERTHANKSFADLCQIVLSDAAAQQKFGDRAKMILGQKGTMLFEETSSYHKASNCKTERLMLSIDYVLQRRPPPDRPVIAIKNTERKKIT